MNKTLHKAGLVLLLISLVAGCQKDSVPQIEIVAEVGDRYLTRDQLNNWMPPSLPEEQKNAVALEYIDRWVQKTTLAIAAEKDGIVLTDYEKWTIGNLKNDMLSRKYLDTKLPGEIIITDEELSNYYEAHKEEFTRDKDEVHLVQLFLENQDRAISTEIRESNSLLDVVEKNYLDQPASRLVGQNGDIGYIPIDNVRKEILWTIKNGRTGRIYGPVKIESGYYYFQMMDKKSRGTVRSLDLVKDQIRLRLMNIKKNKLAQKIAEKQGENFTIKTYPEHIK